MGGWVGGWKKKKFPAAQGSTARFDAGFLPIKCPMQATVAKGNNYKQEADGTGRQCAKSEFRIQGHMSGVLNGTEASLSKCSQTYMRAEPTPELYAAGMILGCVLFETG